MRADRLLSALLLLQANGKMTVRQLAARLEVSRRTAHRDMEALGAAGVPVIALRGAQGGWMLDEEWRTRVPGLDESELRALLMTQPRVVGDGPLAAAAERALDKLMAAMPVSLRARAAFLRQRLYVDMTGWRGVAENLAHLPVVQDAVSRDRKLTIRYRKANGEIVERFVDPLGLVAKGMTWYLVANTPNGLRTFRVSRIEKAASHDMAIERPPDFDLAAYWKTSTEKFRESPRYIVTLRVARDAAAELMRWHGATPVADGELRVRFENERHATFIVRGFGPDVEVIEPVELRDRLLADARAVIQRFC